MSGRITLKRVHAHRLMFQWALFTLTFLGTALNAAAQTRDYGDAPATYGTTIAASGAAHIVPGYNSVTNTSSLMLGASVDLEADGTPGTIATGDNFSGINDEDAISRFPLIIPGATSYSVTVAVTNSTGAAATVNGWIDWNRNGVFDGAELATASVASGATSVTLNWPAFAAMPNFGYLYARFRIASVAAEIASSTGLASNGEVEDHRFFIGRPVSGTVFNDLNRNTRIDGAPETFAGLPAPVFMHILQGGAVVDVIPAATNGTYNLRGPAGQTSTIEFSLIEYPIGSTSAINHATPAGWVRTGENASGTNTGSGDLNPNGIINFSIPTGTTSIVARNFGIACARAGTDRSWDICASDRSELFLSEFLEDEDPGGTWSYVSGTGITFDPIGETVQLTGSATNSTYQYSIAANGLCAATTSTVTIVVRQAPVTYQSFTICQGQGVCVFNPRTGSGRTGRGVVPGGVTVCHVSSGVYTDTLLGASQLFCDSIVVTTLTVVPVPTLAVTNATCTPFGSVSITSPTGAAYTYSRDNITFQSSPDFTNLPVGNYTFYVNNSASTCVTSAPATITQQTCAPVPVGLLYFDANKAGKNAELVWATSFEQNNKGFEIERSSDGINWKTIATVNSKAAGGNSQVKIQYNAIDNAPLNGNNFYRLKQIDFDGKFVYSSVQNVLFEQEAFSFYPNPVVDELLLSGLKELTSLQLFNAHGQLIKTVQLNAINTIKIDMAKQTAGIYIIKTIEKNGKISSYKIIKKQ